jgi:hypothetical protein
LDRFLFEILEWKREAVFTEPSTDSGYIDYLLTIGERRNAMVIEAKRLGRLQPATKGEEVMSVALSGPVVKPLLPGIRQAMGIRNGKRRGNCRRDGRKHMAVLQSITN